MKRASCRYVNLTVQKFSEVQAKAGQVNKASPRLKFHKEIDIRSSVGFATRDRAEDSRAHDPPPTQLSKRSSAEPVHPVPHGVPARSIRGADPLLQRPDVMPDVRLAHRARVEEDAGEL